GTPGTGTNSIIGDPMFVDPQNRNFKLREESPCINAGIHVNIPFDMDGVEIPVGAQPDIGAYEFMPTTGSGIINRDKLKIYPNPSSGIFNIHMGMTDKTKLAFEVRN